jgi:hypothetical protein
MPSQEDIQTQQGLLNAHRQTLALYLQQSALLGAAYIPPGVAHGIADARRNIRNIKATLREWGVPVVNHPNDEQISAPSSDEFLASPARGEREKKTKQSRIHIQGNGNAVVGGNGNATVNNSGETSK